MTRIVGTLSAVLSLFWATSVMATPTDVPLECPDPGTCFGGVTLFNGTNPLDISGTVDSLDPNLIHWWLKFENNQHVEPPLEDAVGPGLFGLEFYFSTQGGGQAASTYSFVDAYLTDMDERIPEERAALDVFFGPPEFDNSFLELITDWETFGADPIFIHDLHLTLQCDPACSSQPELLLTGYELVGFTGDLTPGTWEMEVAEPMTLSLIGIGLVGLIFRRRRIVTQMASAKTYYSQPF